MSRSVIMFKCYGESVGCVGSERKPVSGGSWCRVVVYHLTLAQQRFTSGDRGVFNGIVRVVAAQSKAMSVGGMMADEAQ